jgi:hypothetical protein
MSTAEHLRYYEPLSLGRYLTLIEVACLTDSTMTLHSLMENSLSRRRRGRRSAKSRTAALYVVAIVACIGIEAKLHLGFVAGIAFGAVAIAIWYSGAQNRLKHIHRWGAVANMYALTPDDFEQHVAQTYEALGYQTTVTARVGDQGIDVIAIRGPEKIGIQCKRSNDRVANGAVQEAFAGKAHYRCSHAAVIALGGFTTSAKSLSTSTGVTLIDGSSYADLFHRAQAALPNRSPWTVIPYRRTVLGAAAFAAMSVISLSIGLST